MPSTLRWIAFLPLGFLASLVGSTFMEWTGRLLAVWQWGVLTLGGIGAALGFFAAAFFVAPRVSAPVKWSSVVSVVALGGTSVAGALLVNNSFLLALPGLLMIATGAAVAATPLIEIQKSIESVRRPGAA